MVFTAFLKSNPYVNQVNKLILFHPDVVISGHPVWKVALAIHVTAWILQFIGHGVFEGRAPALLDSLDQALITAPLFVLLEVGQSISRVKIIASVFNRLSTLSSSL